ncbi:MAG: hypothetical protein QME75_06380 [Deltaproteobacteria bacterium]|nr:hypothetical protein [Deltaproteobacteria bacterium]
MSLKINAIAKELPAGNSTDKQMKIVRIPKSLINRKSPFLEYPLGKVGYNNFTEVLPGGGITAKKIMGHSRRFFRGGNECKTHRRVLAL